MPEQPHVCPVWVGYLLASPLRRLFQNPARLLTPYVREGMIVLEPGPGMGFFTLELARLVGPKGRVVAVDIQPKMLRELARRARKAGVSDRLDLREPAGSSMNIDDLRGQIGFVFAMAVVHELSDPKHFFREAFESLMPGGILLVAEPRGHVKPLEWKATCNAIRETGFAEESAPRIRGSRAGLFKREL